MRPHLHMSGLRAYLHAAVTSGRLRGQSRAARGDGTMNAIVGMVIGLMLCGAAAVLIFTLLVAHGRRDKQVEYIDVEAES